MMVGAYIPSLVFDEPEVEYRKLYPLWQWVELFVRETGYFHFHVTKPDTVGASLVDSPVGLAAYLLERFAAATDRNYVDKEDGGLTDKFTMDELLTNVMIYWTSGNVASSLRLYKESVVRFVELRLAEWVKTLTPVDQCIVNGVTALQFRLRCRRPSLTSPTKWFVLLRHWPELSLKTWFSLLICQEVDTYQPSKSRNWSHKISEVSRTRF